MGVTFIGNPFDQETEYDDSDWEMNAAEEWIMPPQEIAFVEEEGRGTVDLILAPEGLSDSNEEDDSDEDYNPDDEEESADNLDIQDYDSYFFDSNDDEDEDEIDYVTYPIAVRDEQNSETEKVTTNDSVNQDENNDTD